MASKHVHYHVEPTDEGLWKVSPGEDSQPSSLHASKKAAIESAEHLARKGGSGEVVVHGSDGSIEQQRTVLAQH